MNYHNFFKKLLLLGLMSTSVLINAGYLQRAQKLVEEHPKIAAPVGVLGGIGLAYYTYYKMKPVVNITKKKIENADPFKHVMGVEEAQFSRLSKDQRKHFVDKTKKVLIQRNVKERRFSWLPFLSREVDTSENLGEFPYGEFTVIGLKRDEDDIKEGDKPEKSSLTFNIIARSSVNAYKYKCLVDVSALQADPENNGAVFQVASNFNCLEGSGPIDIGSYFSPAMFVQGESAATSGMAALIYRAYFSSQVNLLENFSNVTLRDGYPTYSGYKAMQAMDYTNRNWYKKICLGVHTGVQPIFKNTVAKGYSRADANIVNLKDQKITQVFTAAVNLAGRFYVENGVENFAKGCLKAAYEGTLQVAADQAGQKDDDEEEQAGNEKRQKVFLTMVGGGVFKNNTEWIIAAIEHALDKYKQKNLEVNLVLYFEPKNPKTLNKLKSLISNYNGSYKLNGLLVSPPIEEKESD